MTIPIPHQPHRAKGIKNGNMIAVRVACIAVLKFLRLFPAFDRRHEETSLARRRSKDKHGIETAEYDTEDNHLSQCRMYRPVGFSGVNEDDLVSLTEMLEVGREASVPPRRSKLRVLANL